MSVKYSVLRAGLTGLRGLYSIMKLRKTKNRISIISRQSDTPSMDISMLKEYLEKNHPEIECRVMTKFISKGLAGKLAYAFNILSQMRSIAVSKVVIIDGYCIAVSVLKHKPETKIIQMWHAMAAIKQFGYQTQDKESGHSSRLSEIMCMHKNYDYIICPSEETGKIFCMGFNSTPDKLKFFALPRIDYLLDETDVKATILKANIKAKAKGRKTILYVPTFRSNGKVNLNELCQALDFEQCYLVISPHPLDVANFENAAAEIASSMYAEDAPNTSVKENLTIDSTMGSFGWIKACDMIITDYSAIGIEALVTDKPIFYYLYDIDDYKEEVGLNIDLFEEMPHCTAKDAAELMTMINSEYNFSELIKFKNKYISADTNGCTEKLAEFAVSLCK